MVSELIQMILDETEEKMEKALSHLLHELGSIRAGRANPVMLENIKVDYYGNLTPLNQMSSVSAPQADLLLVQPWDASAISEIERAIISANLGVTPSNDGTLIRIPVPPLSEERRKELAKSARTRGEDARVAVRNIRRSAKDEIKSIQQSENLPEDMRYEGEEVLQKMTDRFVEEVEKLLDKKEKDIMAV